MFPLLLATAVVVSLTSGQAEPISFELHHNVIFVKASVGNSPPLDFALDSGTKRTTLDQTVAERIGLDLSMKAKSSGANGLQEISVVRDQILRFAGFEVHEPLLMAYPLDFLSKRLGRQVDGIIGVELLRKYVLEIDYPAGRLRVIEPAAFKYSGDGEIAPVSYHERLPLIAVAVKPHGKAPIPTRLQVDTGGAAAKFALWQDFVSRNGLLEGARDVVDAEITAFGGTRTWKRGRIEAIEIGTLRVDNPEVYFAPYQYGGASTFGGNLGTDFLKQFKVIFDLPHDRMIFERPGPLATLPIEINHDLVFLSAYVSGAGPFRMVFDSAMRRSTVDEAIATKLGLDLSMKAQSSGIRGLQQVSVLKDQEVKVGGLGFTEPLMLSYPLDFLSTRLGTRVDGMIGVGLLKHFVAVLDFEARELRLYAPETFSYSGPGEVLPITYDQNLPIVQGSLTPLGRDAVPAKLLLDTGASGMHVLLWKGYYQKHDLLSAARELRDVQNTEFGGTMTVKHGRMQALRIGNLAITDPEVRFSGREFGDAEVTNGVLGMRFFLGYRVVFDLPRDRVILEAARR